MSLANLSNQESPKIIQGDCQEILKSLEPDSFQTIIADPPYFQVLLEENWDNQWKTEEDYSNWTESWIKKAGNLLKTDGLFFIFGQLANASICGFTSVRWQRVSCSFTIC